MMWMTDRSPTRPDLVDWLIELLGLTDKFAALFDNPASCTNYRRIEDR